MILSPLRVSSSPLSFHANTHVFAQTAIHFKENPFHPLPSPLAHPTSTHHSSNSRKTHFTLFPSTPHPPPPSTNHTSQGVRSTKSYFTTPHGNLFTQSFIPLDKPVKATVYMSHGYGSDTWWLFQKICIVYARWGYAVFAVDLLGHGRSDGIRCYLGDMAKVAAALLSFFLSVRRSEEYKGLPAFLFGKSMRGLATMLMYFQSEAGHVDGPDLLCSSFCYS